MPAAPASIAALARDSIFLDNGISIYEFSRASQVISSRIQLFQGYVIYVIACVALVRLA